MAECELHITLVVRIQADGLPPAMLQELEQICKTSHLSYAGCSLQMWDGSFAALISNKQSLERSAGSVELSLTTGHISVPARVETYTQLRRDSSGQDGDGREMPSKIVRLQTRHSIENSPTEI